MVSPRTTTTTPKGTIFSLGIILVLVVLSLLTSRYYEPLLRRLQSTGQSTFQQSSATYRGKESIRDDRPSFKSSAKPCPAKSIHNLKQQKLLKSQSEEDEKLLRWFNGLCGGSYIELGALDGIRFSNSYVFNKALDWKGLLVEINPGSYDNLKRNRPSELAVVHAAVCDERKKVHWYGTGAIGGIYEFAAPSFRTQWWNDIDMSQTTEIDCMPLSEIIETHVAAKMRNDMTDDETSHDDDDETVFFDFFSLDVEGAEMAVLESVDYNKVGFGVLLVEADGHNLRKNIALRTFVEEQGYFFLMEHQRSYWFINKDFHRIYHGLLHNNELSGENATTTAA